MQCLVVAPQLLASIAASHTLRWLKPFASRLRALAATWLLGACLAMLGSLDRVAPLLSICFLLCYACAHAHPSPSPTLTLALASMCSLLCYACAARDRDGCSSPPTAAHTGSILTHRTHCSASHSAGA